MSWRPLGITFAGWQFGFRKLPKKLDPVAVTQSGAQVHSTLYCRYNNSGYYICYPTVADAHNLPAPTNGVRYEELPPGALQV